MNSKKATIYYSLGIVFSFCLAFVGIVFKQDWLTIMMGCLCSSFTHYLMFNICNKSKPKNKSIEYIDIFLIILTIVFVIFEKLSSTTNSDSIAWIIIPVGCTSLFSIITRHYPFTSNNENENKTNEN